MSILFSGIYSLLLFFGRKYWVPFVAGENVIKNVTPLHNVNALFIMFIGKPQWTSDRNLFKQCIKITSSNFNLLTSIPWLVGIILIFISVQKKYHFSWTIVLLLSGLYEFTVETVQNGIPGFPFYLGNPLISSTLWAICWFVLWQFVILHSPIYLVIFWAFEDSSFPDAAKRSGWGAFKPLLWLFPYSTYFLILFLIFSLGFQEEITKERICIILFHWLIRGCGWQWNGIYIIIEAAKNFLRCHLPYTTVCDIDRGLQELSRRSWPESYRTWAHLASVYKNGSGSYHHNRAQW